MSQSLEICEGLEEWSGQQYLSNCSDTEEEDGTQLSPGKYKALADCKRRGSEDLLVKNGDEIQLLHEDGGSPVPAPHAIKVNKGFPLWQCLKD
ncbi:hypothetical protein IHE44_0003319 [Lamprotornis superbus]|uniref:SH3 domain-containing protein n=1 Tax=Lamprotornis superbus TaxID=245042 RepID=A0A835NYR2_9PASS|nr:hypothetical protein IHE44_0003319 [Lamprotornis superbus]